LASFNLLWRGKIKSGCSLLLKAPALLVLHDFTNHGYQTASVAPLVALPEVLSQCFAKTSELEAHCTVRETVTEAAKLWLCRLGCPTE
jgi:hypothetical protein